MKKNLRDLNFVVINLIFQIQNLFLLNAYSIYCQTPFLFIRIYKDSEPVGTIPLIRIDSYKFQIEVFKKSIAI